MKLLIIIWISVDVFAQGTLFFNNRALYDAAQGGDYDAPVSLPDGRGAEGEAFTAGLFIVHGQQLDLIKTTHFRTGIAAGFFVPVDAVVPGVPPLSPATFRVRVWETAAGSYEDAISRGMLYGEYATTFPENNVYVPMLGPSPVGLGVDADLSGIRPLTLIPEPTTCALFALGAVALFALSKRRAVRKLPHER